MRKKASEFSTLLLTREDGGVCGRRQIERKRARKNYPCGCGHIIRRGDLYWWASGNIRICDDHRRHWPKGQKKMCEWCGEDFIPKQWWGRFCSAYCRKADWREKQRLDKKYGKEV